MKKNKIIITGASGLLGRHLLPLLKRDKSYRLIPLKKQDCDLTNIQQTIKVIRNAQTIIHLAGLILSRVEQQRRPAEVLYQNLTSTLNLLEAASKNGIQRVILIGSITAYPANSPSPLKEEYLWQGPPAFGSFDYGLSKRMMNVLGRAYYKQYGIEVITVLFPNFYGPGDKFDFNPPPLVPNIIKQLYEAKQKKLPEILGGDNGDFGLDLLYVEDAAECLRIILQTKVWPELLNVGTGKAVKVKHIYSVVAKYLQYEGRIIWRKGLVQNRFLDVSHMRRLLHWYPKTNLQTGLAKTVDWFLTKHIKKY